MKSGNLKFLESSGPLQTCNGVLYLSYLNYIIVKYENTMREMRASMEQVIAE
jgi:hypothetical protein